MQYNKNNHQPGMKADTVVYIREHHISSLADQTPGYQIPAL